MAAEVPRVGSQPQGLRTAGELDRARVTGRQAGAPYEGDGRPTADEALTVSKPGGKPLIGAAAGLVLLLVLESGLLGNDASTWERAGLFAFAAGFSEPFFLGVVNRVTTAEPESGRGTGRN